VDEKVIHEVKVVETEDGFRIEVKGDKEALRRMGFGPWRGQRPPLEDLALEGEPGFDAHGHGMGGPPFGPMHGFHHARMWGMRRRMAHRWGRRLGRWMARGMGSRPFWGHGHEHGGPHSEPPAPPSGPEADQPPAV